MHSGHYSWPQTNHIKILLKNRMVLSHFACLFYFTVHRCTKLFGPKVKQNKQASKKVENFRINFRRSLNVALRVRP